MRIHVLEEQKLKQSLGELKLGTFLFLWIQIQKDILHFMFLMRTLESEKRLCVFIKNVLREAHIFGLFSNSFWVYEACPRLFPWCG